jgi:hypothetical protein
VELADGRKRSVGRFTYQALTSRGQRLRAVGGGTGCTAPASRGREVSYNASTRSEVRRLRGGRFRYAYEATNGTADAALLTWETLQHLGTGEPFELQLVAGGTLRVTRESRSPPVLVAGSAQLSALAGCLPGAGGPRGWTGDAFFPEDTLPPVEPVRSAELVEGENGDVTVRWEFAADETPDAVEVSTESVGLQFDLFRGRRTWRQLLRHRADARWVAAPATEYRLLLGDEGVYAITVRALRNGVRSEPVRLTLVR